MGQESEPEGAEEETINDIRRATRERHETDEKIRGRCLA